MKLLKGKEFVLQPTLRPLRVYFYLPAMDKTYSIGDLSREFNVTTRALRFYEEKGLLAPNKLGRSRVYSAADRVRLTLVLRGKFLGLSLEESAELIGMYEPGSNNSRQIQVLIGKIQDRKRLLEQQKQEITKMIDDLDAWEERSRQAMEDVGLKSQMDVEPQTVCVGGR